jgi:hypothetical protein
MVVEMKSIKLYEVLVVEINKRYRDNVEINELCRFIGSKLIK